MHSDITGGENLHLQLLFLSRRCVFVRLVRSDRSPALTGAYMVDLCSAWLLDATEIFVVNDKQYLPFSSNIMLNLNPALSFGTASASLVTVPLDSIGRREKLKSA